MFGSGTFKLHTLMSKNKMQHLLSTGLTLKPENTKKGRNMTKRNTIISDINHTF